MNLEDTLNQITHNYLCTAQCYALHNVMHCTMLCTAQCYALHISHISS
jgi:hypothetical protein